MANYSPGKWLLSYKGFCDQYMNVCSPVIPHPIPKIDSVVAVWSLVMFELFPSIFYGEPVVKVSGPPTGLDKPCVTYTICGKVLNWHVSHAIR